jgi:hypothetical protein
MLLSLNSDSAMLLVDRIVGFPACVRIWLSAWPTLAATDQRDSLIRRLAVGCTGRALFL